MKKMKRSPGSGVNEEHAADIHDVFEVSSGRQTWKEDVSRATRSLRLRLLAATVVPRGTDDQDRRGGVHV